ncbi:MAG: PTS sugar transporter subunit IIA [Planctomycetota bacterium]|jgi:PTS system fructose-specific IIA component|nr:PTS sugar transporter subunit IIA [Planctomycetota bacterium]MSR37352.1 PTS sugar transporter subunit IIA [Planctomycetota bacterium]
MKLSLLIRPELIAVPFRAIDKWQTLAALAELPVRAGCYAASAMPAILDAILLRERSMSTGMEFGVAIPHAAVDGIDELITVLGICPDGIPFDAVDKQPARIVVLLIIPRQKKLAHIKTLAEIARLLSRGEVRSRLLTSNTPAEVVQAVIELENVTPRG